jgi:hypothetical protein
VRGGGRGGGGDDDDDDDDDDMLASCRQPAVSPVWLMPRNAGHGMLLVLQGPAGSGLSLRLPSHFSFYVVAALTRPFPTHPASSASFCFGSLDKTSCFRETTTDSVLKQGLVSEHIWGLRRPLAKNKGFCLKQGLPPRTKQTTWCHHMESGGCNNDKK